MNRRRIIPIVEGHGEEKAVPCLLRRWLRHRRLHQFDVPDLAINAKGCGKLKAGYDRSRHLGIEHYIEAALRNRPDAILVVLDADDECRNRLKGNGLGTELLMRARKINPNIPLAVVVADPEYEAWFLASLTSIRRAGLLPDQSPRIKENSVCLHPRGCKGAIADLLCCPYEETVHQLALTQGLTFSSQVQHRSYSYGKLLRDLERLAHEVLGKAAVRTGSRTSVSRKDE
ncbi:MAG: DUF4276 family protein [Desulfobacteraceae bacterium]|nr:MAG: DUF4276 family protein [Desulfobacteraceae bacterium]